jgi:hypothetical protein
MLTPSNSSGTEFPHTPTTIPTTQLDLTAHTLPEPKVPTLPLKISNFSLSDIAEAVLRERSGILEPISLTPANTSNLAAQQLSLICNPIQANTWIGCAEYGDTKSYLGVQLYGLHSVKIEQIIDGTRVRSIIALETIQSYVACLPYYRMPIKELIESYLKKVDSLFEKYSHHLKDFDSPLTSLRHPTTLQRDYDAHCKVSWITSSYSEEEEVIIPEDIQEIKEMQRILITRKDEVFSTAIIAERNCLHRAHAEVMKEVSEFYFSDINSHQINRICNKTVANLLNGVVSWLVRNAPYNDAPLNKFLQAAETDYFFNRFATLYLILSITRDKKIL